MKFEKYISVVGISLVATVVVIILSSYFYHLGYHDGIEKLLNTLNNASQSSGSTQQN
jgi:hypothetical protein